MLIAVALMTVPGALVARAGGLRWPLAAALSPALTYGVVGLATVPFGAVGIRWSAASALAALAGVTALAFLTARLLTRYRRPGGPTPRGPVLTAAAGVVFGAVAIGAAAWRGMPDWQSIPSTWDAVWHANTVRWILDTGQASPTHMGELRNVETRAELFYPTAFHALAAVFAQLTGAAPTTAYTLSALAAATWLFPLSAGLLTWQLIGSRTTRWRTAGASGTAAALSASFTAVPYVEFATAAMPNLTAYGIVAPAFVLITTSVTSHRDRIPLAVLAVVGVFSVHLSGGAVLATFAAAWWLQETLRRPLRDVLSRLAALAAIAVPALLLLAPQFLAVARQVSIIAGHAYVTPDGRRRAVFDAVFQHTRHLNDFPIQNILIGLAGVGFLMLLAWRIFWPAGVWLLLVAAIVHSSAPFGGPLGAAIGLYSDLFYSDPRRLSGALTLLLTPMAGIALFAAGVVAAGWARRLGMRGARAPALFTAVVVVTAVVALTWHYFPRHRFLMGDKYDSVMVSDADLAAFAYLAELPGARETVIGNANIDGTAWMYAVAGLHPLWTHYDYPVQQGPGYHRFVIWAYADDADSDPRVAEAVRALDIRYLITSTPVVRGFVTPDGLVSLDKSTSWAKIYDNGGARIYEWRGHP